MDKDRIVGVLKEARGALKDRAGKTVGRTKAQAEGKAEKIAGHGRNDLGRAKDALRDAKKEADRR
jgi:uncharacterized protein YjbJ (UPF0337 family)